MNLAVWRIDYSIYHRVLARKLCSLSILKNKVKWNCLVVATNTYNRIFKSHYRRETQLIGKLGGISCFRITWYRYIRRYLYNTCRWLLDLSFGIQHLRRDLSTINLSLFLFVFLLLGLNDLICPITIFGIIVVWLLQYFWLFYLIRWFLLTSFLVFTSRSLLLLLLLVKHRFDSVLHFSQQIWVFLFYVFSAFFQFKNVFLMLFHFSFYVVV